MARKRAWPAPKPIDMRTESTGYVLDANYSKVRDRRGRRAKSLPKLLRRIHPRAERALERATKAGLARMDTRARASQSGRGCTEQPTGTVSSSFDAGGGQSVDLTMTGGPEASLQLGLESNQGNRRVRLEIEFPGCESHSFDSCPTADGQIRGKDSRRISVRATVTEGNTVVWSQGIRLEGETTFRGVVDDDAKLDFFEPHNTEVGTLTSAAPTAGSRRCRSGCWCSASRAWSIPRRRTSWPEHRERHDHEPGPQRRGADGRRARDRARDARAGRPAVPRHHRQGDQGLRRCRNGVERRERVRVDRVHTGGEHEDAASRRVGRLRRAHQRQARRLAGDRHVDARERRGVRRSHRTARRRTPRASRTALHSTPTIGFRSRPS